MKIRILLLISIFVSPLSALAQTVTGIQSGNVQAADDFATRAFQDPWDMNQRTDLGPLLGSADLPSSGFTNISFANGVFSGTTTAADASVWLLDTGNPLAVPIGKTGTNHPIDASTYRLLAVRMSTSAARQIFVYSWDSNIYQSSPELIPGPATTTGYRTYLIDLSASASWAGTRGALRFDPAEGAFPVNVAIDWARLVSVDASLCRTISWTGASGSVNIYLDTDTTFSNGHLGPIALNLSTASGGVSAGCSSPAANSYKFYAGALPAGTYYVAVSNAGTDPTASNYFATPWTVNEIPTLVFTSPNEEGSDDDFATSQLNNPWDMDSLSDVDLTRNVTSPQITSLTVQTPEGTSVAGQRVYRATSSNAGSCGAVGDPQLEVLHNNARGFSKHIDANRYRIFTVEFGVPNRARGINCGSIARIIWRGRGDLGPGSVSDDIIFNSRAGVNMLDKITVDMKTLLVEQGTGVGGTNWVNGPTGGIDIFRFDPLEYPEPTQFIIKRMKLTSLEQARTSYTIRWNYSKPSGTVDLFYDDNGSGFNGTQIANNVDATAGQFTWSIPGALPQPPPGRAVHIYAIFTDGTNENRVYAKWPLLLDSSYNPRPRMVLNRNVLNYGITAGTIKTGPQVVRVNFVGSGGPACWTVVNSQPGIFNVSPTTGTGNGQFTISLVDQTYPGGGSGVGIFTLNECSPNTILNPGLQVVANYRIWGSSTAPAGVVETPANGANVAGSVAVTGWAVDDIDITAIQVYRMNGATPVFIGNAVRVDDARPDVESFNPNSPFNYRGGWGYLLLSNFLPNFGDGQHVLRIYATDREGRQTLLGERTINGNNSGSTVPFGAIDTPAQGGLVTGAAYNNFGWVLSRGPRFADPPHGGSVFVYIDGILVGSPGGWTSRPDLSRLFPELTYPGITHAAGVFTFDSTTYSNGVHTIAWVAFNDGGQGAGIGSRYFTIQNGSSGALRDGRADVITAPSLIEPPPNLGRRIGDFASVDLGPAVRLSRGYAVRRTSSAIDVDGAGLRTVHARASERLVIDASTPGARSYEAYLLAGGRLGQLPIGASFDERRGILYWAPPLGFAGVYDFAIVRDGRTAVPVRVSVSPEPARVSTTDRLMRGLFTVGG